MGYSSRTFLDQHRVSQLPAEINSHACCRWHFSMIFTNSSNLHHILISVPTALADILMRIGRAWGSLLGLSRN
jgi:hypothetical protein